MAIPQGTKIPVNSSFSKLQEGANKFRILSPIEIGWEGWKDNKPFRHRGALCQIKPEQVDLNQNGKPNINYIWVMSAYDYQTKAVKVLELTQKTIMQALQALEENEDWGDLMKYDITITKGKNGDKTTYTTMPSPVKPLAPEIVQLYKDSKETLDKTINEMFDMEVEQIDEDQPPF